MFVSLFQIDAKRIVAYSSIAHMNFGLLGLFSDTVNGASASFLVMFSHCFSSVALFYLIGILYRRYNTRSIFYYGGLAEYMPQFTFFFMFFTLANIAFPLTMNFVGELWVIGAIIVKSPLLFIFVVPTLILNLVNSILLFTRICFGLEKENLVEFYDLTLGEYFVLFSLTLPTLILGFAPNFILDYWAGL